MTTNTTPANPGAVIDIKLSEAAAKHAGSAFATPLGASLNSLFNAHKQAIDATKTEGTQAPGSGFNVNIGNNTTVSVNGLRIEIPGDKPGAGGGFIMPKSITVTQANVSSSVMKGESVYFYESSGNQIHPYPEYNSLTSYQYSTVDTSPSSVLGNTSTQLNGIMAFLTTSWSEGPSHYYSYLTGKLSQLSFKATKLLKSADIKGSLDVSAAEVTTFSVGITSDTPDSPETPAQTWATPVDIAEIEAQIAQATTATSPPEAEVSESTIDILPPTIDVPTPTIQVSTGGSISSVNAAYYDGSYVRMNSSTPVPVTGEISLLGALANAALWAGDDKVNIILPDHIEQSININTGAGNDTVTAKGGDGELMIDTGDGDDLITLLDDQPSLRTGDGIDTLRAGFARIEMVRYSGLENLVFTGRSAVSIDGNELDNEITAGSGSDTINGDAGNDTLNGLAGHDALNGGFGDDRLFGGAGNDVLNGGEGNDALYGGAGNDIYLIDGGEIVSEIRSLDSSVDSGGMDEVRSLIHYSLGAYLEKLTLLGEANLNGTGNSLANTITGNSGHNILKGEAGNDLLKGEAGDDRLYGGTGNDTLWGGEGNDILKGEEGADTLWGGSGDDVYYVDDVRDRVSEAVSGTDSNDAGGEDTVFSTTSFVLNDQLEHLHMLGEAHINGTGNAGANAITGNSGDNIINGKGGIDDLNGGNGSDIYLIGHPDEHSAAEIYDKGFNGVDEVRFSPTASPAPTGASSGTPPAAPKLTLFEGDVGIERVVIGTGTGKIAVTSGKIAADIDASAVKNGLTLIGNAGVNTMTGTAFDDTLIGNGGKDVLTGGAGKDKFVFNTTPNAKTEVDTIKDFTHGEDTLVFVRSKFANIGAAGDLAESAFYAGDGAIKAQDADDRFIFDTQSGNLYFDRDGSGSSAAVLIGVLTPGTQLSATDFKIVDMI